MTHIPMTRLRADILLLITAIIWGTAFIAQKTGMENGLGPLGFSGARFALAALAVAPLAWREARRHPGAGADIRCEAKPLAALCLLLFIALTLQQVGLVTASVTNAGFLTGLYALFVPFFAWWFFQQRPRAIIWPACLIAVTGVWFLNGGALDAFVIGDRMMLVCALCLGAYTALLGVLAQRMRRPMTICLLQYLACSAPALLLALWYEGLTLAPLLANWQALCYAGLISGGIAYTLQVVAQQYTPPSDAGIILSGEALFAALAAAWLLGERLDELGWMGCALILLAMLLVEAGALIRKKAVV